LIIEDEEIMENNILTIPIANVSDIAEKNGAILINYSK